MNKPVSFELAKLLKEKGYDRPTLLCYDKCDILSSYVETVFKPKNYNTSGYVKSAPTIAEVVMWLYEKHGVWISVSCDCGNDNLFYSKIFSTEIGIERCIWTIRDKNSPIEAYEAAIEYSLKYLL